MKQLVDLKKGKILTTSLIFAEEFKIAHMHILEKIKNLTIEYSIVKDQFLEDVYTNNRNRQYPFFYITRDGYMTLVMNISAKGESLKLLFEKKQQFIAAFNKMEELVLKQLNNKNNIEWEKTREQGRAIRLELTDTIKEFVDYAKNQGSKHAEMYYANITKMEYKALGIIQQSKPEIRNTLDTLQIYQLLLAEDIAKKMIKNYMNDGLHYKEIYILVKNDILEYAKSLKIGMLS